MHIDAEDWRPHQQHLFGVAYRLLGSATDAEDAVQETYLRADRAAPLDVQDLRAWLTTVVSRICLDQLKSARVRREAYVGPWLPEPLLGEEHLVGGAAGSDPAEQVTMAESVEMAMLVVLESLTPAERTSFVLHDVFGLSYAQIATTVGRSEVACRKLASKARRLVRAEVPRFDVDRAEHARVVAAFERAASAGDFEALVSTLDPDAVVRTDAGGTRSAALQPVRGAEKVARLLLGLNQKYGGFESRVEDVNGLPGFSVYVDGSLFAVVAVAVRRGAVHAVDIVLNPEKLQAAQARLGGQRSRPPV